MKLRNPPIVEAWIEFHIRGSAVEATWPQGIKRFLDEIAPDCPNVERQVRETFEVVERRPDGLPTEVQGRGEVEKFRAFDTDRRWCVQLKANALVVNSIKRQDCYPGFKPLLAFAMAQFDRYVDVFHPQSVMSAVLHYADVISIPRPSELPFRIEDHFRLGISVPDEDRWPIGRLALEMGMRLSDAQDGAAELLLGFRREPPTAGTNQERFRMDWHASCLNLDTLSREVVTTRLVGIHDSILDRFRTCFTDSTWSLFGEIQE